MNFNVKFDAPYYSVFINQKPVGLRLIDKIRNSLGVNLPIERIGSHTNSLLCYPVVQITEDMARKSGHFHEANGIVVHCDNQQLNEFVDEVVEKEVSKENGEILHAKIKLVVNNELLIEAWKNACYPIIWKTK
jgi:hypothetical protein